MYNRHFTLLLSFMANSYETSQFNGCKMKPEFMKRYLLSKFPALTETQIKHILKILC